MKIYYLSTTSYSDTDTNIINSLASLHQITYGVIFESKKNNYSVEYLTKFSKENKISFIPFHLKFRRRNLRLLPTHFRIIRSIKLSKPDIIYINNFDDIYLNSLLAIFIPAKITIIALHDVLTHSGIKNSLFLNIGKNILLKKYKNFLTFSAFQQKILIDKLPDKKVYAIPMALKDFGVIDERLKSKNTTNFLFFGNIQPYKGMGALISAINQLARKYNNFSLTIAGRCVDWEAIYQPLIEKEEFFNVQIGFIENDKIPGFFAQAHYLVLPYKDVTQSGPLLIAHNYDVPTIASNLPGFNEFIVNDQTGFLFDIEDDENLYDVLEKSLLLNEDNYNVLVENLIGYKIGHFSISRIVDSYNEMFKMVKGN